MAWRRCLSHAHRWWQGQRGSVGVGFAGAMGHRGGAGQALQALRLAPKAIPVVADFGQQPWGQLGPGARQRAKQVMVGMTPEEFLDALTVEAELLFDGKEHLHQAEGQQAFSVSRGRAATEVGGMGEELQPARAAFRAPEVSSVQKLISFPELFTAERSAPAKLGDARL